MVDAGRKSSGLQHPQHLANAEYPHHALDVVSKHMKTHFRTYTWQSLRQEVRSTHPHLERTERMLHRPAAHSHAVGGAIQSVLHCLENGFVLPTRDAPIFTGRALRFDRAARTSRGPIFINC